MVEVTVGVLGEVGYRGCGTHRDCPFYCHLICGSSVCTESQAVGTKYCRKTTLDAGVEDLGQSASDEKRSIYEAGVGKVDQYADKIDILTSSMDTYGIPFCIPTCDPPSAFAVNNRSTFVLFSTWLMSPTWYPPFKSIPTPGSRHLSIWEGERRSAKAQPEGGSGEVLRSHRGNPCISGTTMHQTWYLSREPGMDTCISERVLLR